MASNPKQIDSAFLLAGFNLLMIVLLAVFLIDREATEIGEPVNLASGEWAPYSGEDLPDYGVASSIVTTVLAHLGHTAQLHFMPWEQAESLALAGERSEDIRATFPYINVGERDRDFYFSLPIFDVEYGIFFNPKHFDVTLAERLPAGWNDDTEQDITAFTVFTDEDVAALKRQRYKLQYEQDARWETLQDMKPWSKEEAEQEIEALKKKYLRKFNRLLAITLVLRELDARIVPINGYEYPDAFAGLFELPKKPVKNNVEAFEVLKRSDRPLVVIEARDVAKRLLLEHYRENYLAIYGTAANKTGGKPEPADIQLLPRTFTFSVHLMAGKRNPDNYVFIKRFNRQLLKLEIDDTLARVKNRVLQQLDRSQKLRLLPIDNNKYLRVYLDRQGKGDHILLIAGTEAVVVDWGPDFLLEQTGTTLLPRLIKIKIIQGPHRGREAYADGRNLMFP
jgi:hypothetical protein